MSTLINQFEQRRLELQHEWNTSCDGTLKEGFLPKNFSGNIIGVPTMNRWGNKDFPGAMCTFLSGIQEAPPPKGNGGEEEVTIVIADGSGQAMSPYVTKTLDVTNQYAKNVQQEPMPVYILTLEQQKLVFEQQIAIIRSQGVTITDEVRAALRTILVDTGYASNRAKIDSVVGDGILVQADDDLFIPKFYGILRDEFLEHWELEKKPNSQIYIPERYVFWDDNFEWRENRFMSIFQYLGRTVKDIEQVIKTLIPLTRGNYDTMNTALLNTVKHNTLSQFEVGANKGGGQNRAVEIFDKTRAKVLAVHVLKYVMGDVRTINAAIANLLTDLPSDEIPTLSYLSGAYELFAHIEGQGNLDSALFGRDINGKTGNFPYWFVSNIDFSLQNPYKTVEGPYRSDNEFLPEILSVLNNFRKDIIPVYLSGIPDVAVEHRRDKSGHRPGIVIHQAPASEVGNGGYGIASEIINGRMSFDSDMKMTIERILYPHRYEMPEEKARMIYEKLKGLTDICIQKYRHHRHSNPKKADQYKEMYKTLKSKLANFNFSEFWKALSLECAQQVNHFSHVAELWPQVRANNIDLIQSGQYPVTVFQPGK